MSGDRRGENEGRIYVRDIVKLVIMLREPTSFLIAGEPRRAGAAGLDVQAELAEQAAERLMAANENWTAMGTRAEIGRP